MPKTSAWVVGINLVYSFDIGCRELSGWLIEIGFVYAIVEVNS